MPHGKLTVVVESATDIKDPTSHKRGDSYCTLQCGSQVLSTHVAEGGGSYPVYHTQFEFEIDRSTNDLAISVYSRDLSRSEDELVGYTALDFKQVFYHGLVVPLSAYPLTRLSGKAGGSINISLDFKVRPSPYMNGGAHAPVRQHSAPQHHARSDFDDGYGSSGSDSSRGSTGRRSSTGSADVRRTQSQPNDHRYDHQIQYYQEVPRPSSLAPATGVPARRPIPGGPQPPRVVPNQAQPMQQPVYYQAPQQPVYIQVQAAPQQPVYNQPQAQQRPVQQRRPVQQQRPVQRQQQQPQGPSVAAQVGTVVAATAAKAAMQGLFGLLEF